MRYLILGALLGLLLAFPTLWALVASVAVTVASKPLVVAFGLGLAAGLRAPWLRRWAR